MPRSATVANTNRKFLAAYKGADGIKTGYTRAAGSNLVASAERGNVRILTTVFGASSSTARNAKRGRAHGYGLQTRPPPRGGAQTGHADAIPAMMSPRPEPKTIRVAPPLWPSLLSARWVARRCSAAVPGTVNDSRRSVLRRCKSGIEAADCFGHRFGRPGQGRAARDRRQGRGGLDAGGRRFCRVAHPQGTTAQDRLCRRQTRRAKARRPIPSW